MNRLGHFKPNRELAATFAAGGSPGSGAWAGRVGSGIDVSEEIGAALTGVAAPPSERRPGTQRHPRSKLTRARIVATTFADARTSTLSARSTPASTSPATSRAAASMFPSTRAPSRTTQWAVVWMSPSSVPRISTGTVLRQVAAKAGALRDNGAARMGEVVERAARVGHGRLQAILPSPIVARVRAADCVGRAAERRLGASIGAFWAGGVACATCLSSW
ncbi:MAG: hypothetical protein MZU95_16670 [Desulfomicrobium escambiense]|nr:hypothetical protein [Desulfomicrobium escambiense]